MKYLIIGHPRSGTAYMSKLFKKNGLDVRHERMGRDGRSDWQYAIPNETIFPWGKGVREDYEFDVVIHNIRDPLTAIPSISNTETPGHGVDENRRSKWVRKSEEFRRKYIHLPDKNVFDNAASSYLGWNNIIKKELKDFSSKGLDVRVVRIEHAIEDLHGLGITKPLDKKVNARKHSGISAEEWNKVSPVNLNKLEEFCVDYGYSSIMERLSEL